MSYTYYIFNTLFINSESTDTCLIIFSYIRNNYPAWIWDIMYTTVYHCKQFNKKVATLKTKKQIGSLDY